MNEIKAYLIELCDKVDDLEESVVKKYEKEIEVLKEENKRLRDDYDELMCDYEDNECRIKNLDNQLAWLHRQNIALEKQLKKDVLNR
jgi:chromosome segregation ATPase